MSGEQQSSAQDGHLGGLRQALREQTRSQHEALERRVRLMEPGIALADYVAYLRAMLGYCAPVEERLAQLHGWDAALPDHQQRYKAHLLRQDLLALGDDPASAPRCTRMPSLAQVDDAFGAMYVLEGSTLGGQVLSRHLGPRLGIDAARGGGFLASYGKEVGPMWRRFCEALERHGERRGAHHPDASNRVVAVATATFTALDRWFEERLATP